MTTTLQESNPIIILASRNAHKLREIKSMLPQYTIYSPHEVNITCVPEEHGNSFLENALIKAKEYYCALHDNSNDNIPHNTKNNMILLSEDSGLCVEALQNRPGIYSARYGFDVSADTQSQKNTEHNEHILDTKNPLYQCHLLLEEMKEITNRNAKFVCCAVLMWTLDSFLISQSEWHGEIIQDAPKGKNGFGYDPIFYLPHHDCSSAELSLEEKNKLSHRALAISRFKDVL